MAWTKLKDIFATKKEINEVRDSLSQIKFERIECIVDGGKTGVYEIKHDAQYCFSNAMSSLKHIRTQIKTQDNKMLLYVFNDEATQWRGTVSILYVY